MKAHEGKWGGTMVNGIPDEAECKRIGRDPCDVEAAFPGASSAPAVPREWPRIGSGSKRGGFTPSA